MKKCIVAGVLILNGDATKVLLVKHKKLGVWIYPGGHIEENESPLDCALRESAEETGSSFEVLTIDKFSVNEEGAKSLPRPLVIMDEIVPYATRAHRHFDMIFLGVTGSMDFHCNDESSDCRWFDKGEIDDLETFDNVKEIIRYGFRTFADLRFSTYGTG